MIKRMTSMLLVGAVALSMLAACQRDADSTSSGSAQVEAAVESSAAAVNVVANIAQNTAASAAVAVPTISVAAALAENSQPRDDAAVTAVEDAMAVQIELAGDKITASGDGVTIDGSTATITADGTYSLSGALSDGQIVVDTQDEALVRLILNGVDINSAASAPIFIANAEAVEIVLADETVNTVSDAAAYVFADPADDEPNAAIFSKADLTISGSGSLLVMGNYNDGIASKDGLVIGGGAITVNAADDGIRGKDYLVIEDGQITVTAQGDGLKSDDEEDATKGYIAVENGVIAITAGGDAIIAQTDVLISDGQFTLTSGGGSNSRVDATTSAKGIKGLASVAIDGGTFVIDAADDAIHSNDSLTVNGGDFTLATGDDAMHADATLTINDGAINITGSYEGIESAVITINGGNIDLISSDDGINVAGGNDGSGMAGGMQPGGRPGRGGPGMDAFTYTGNYYLYIHGGAIVVEAAGDGIDVNGAIEMTGGVVIVNGPTANMNGALDYDGGFSISGGYLAAAGSAGMAQAPGSSSSQYSLLLNFPSTLPAGTLIHIQTSAGETLLTIAPSKTFQSIAFSSPALEQGDAIEVYYGGSATGATVGGVYLDGVYTPGDQIASFTVSNVVTQVGNSYR
ncbi:MAG TPA: carbohydrate-binding domain-containing protein [Anaerolineae bacterium]|nr:carbohydrate-binding domain-containing protein [Anaerolineae bacterium]